MKGGVNTKILVTGGMGYVGSVLVKKLLNLGYEVLIVDLMLYENSMDINSNDNVKIIQGDIREQNWDDILSDGIDIVIHLAGISNDPGNGVSREEGFDINYFATINLYNACVKNNVKRFIYPSSCSVYGRQNSNIELTEEAEISPISDYAIAKAKVEKYLLNSVNKMCTTVIRPATVYGISYRQRFDLIVNNFAAEVFYNGSISISNKYNIRPTVNIKDLVEAYILLINSDSSIIDRNIFNLAYDNLSIGEICNIIFNEFNKNVSLKESIDNKSRSYRVSSNKIESLLNYKRRNTLIDGIKELKNEFLNNTFSDYNKNDHYYNNRIQSKYFNIKERK